MSSARANPSSSEITLSAPQIQALTQYLERLMRRQKNEFFFFLIKVCQVQVLILPLQKSLFQHHKYKL